MIEAPAKKRFPKKTSPVPTRVYKYALLPPLVNGERVAEIAAQTQDNYNRLITAARHSRNSYRQERARLFPAYAAREVRYQACEARLATLREAIDAEKARLRTRKVNPALAAEATQIRTEMVVLAAALKGMRPEIQQSPEMQQIAARLHEEVAAVKRELRKTIYWGTYQLYEDAFGRACRSKKDPKWNAMPEHRLESRIGVQLQGGISVAELATDTQIQITHMPEFRNGSARGKAARTTLRLRIESEKGQPVWAEFPMIMHRPFPEDARIMGTYVTRQPYSVRVPFRYAVCFVIESRLFTQPAGGERSLGAVAINFGWRQCDDLEAVKAPSDLATNNNQSHALRVAMVNSDRAGLAEIQIPAWVCSYDEKIAGLDSLIDLQFNAAKSALAAWMKTCDCLLPEGFTETFAHVAQWKSHYRLAKWVWYWHDHRFVGDAEAYELLAAWLARYRHLGDWAVHARERILRWRNGFYREHACRLARQASLIVVDDFDIARVAKKPEAEIEKKGGPAADHNRHLAAVGSFRLAIKQACARFGCALEAAKCTNNTRRCNVCGELYEWDPAQDLVHACPGSVKVPCAAVWDQDVNNTDNVFGHLARGAVAPIVEPAQMVVNADGSEELQPSKTHAWGTARAALRKLLKIK